MRYQVDTADSGFIAFKIPKAGANPVNKKTKRDVSRRVHDKRTVLFLGRESLN
jgi:hypothetical protein